MKKGTKVKVIKQGKRYHHYHKVGDKGVVQSSFSFGREGSGLWCKVVISGSSQYILSTDLEVID
ncbi:hypothetical protein PANI_CDS0021 [Maribacter phage Panino]